VCGAIFIGFIHPSLSDATFLTLILFCPILWCQFEQTGTISFLIKSQILAEYCAKLRLQGLLLQALYYYLRCSINQLETSQAC